MRRPSLRNLNETAPGGAVETREADEADAVDFEPMPTVDPTAVLLGTAKRKRGPRTPRPAAPHAAAPRRPPRAAREDAAKRPSRRKKTSAARSRNSHVHARLTGDVTAAARNSQPFADPELGPLLDEGGLRTARFFVRVRIRVRELDVLRASVDQHRPRRVRCRAIRQRGKGVFIGRLIDR